MKAGENSLTIRYMGKECKAPVTVIDPVESISFTSTEPIVLMEGVDGNWYSEWVWDEETEEYNVFNLWRIVESEKDLYSKRVEDYFKRTYFCDKDLSPISLSLVEAFYNIFDHAQSGNNAFVHMSYNPTDMVLYIAVADMGLGIVNTVKKYSPTIINDVDALREAIKDNFTISSTTHNRGKGLDNILSCANNLQILSGSALLQKDVNNIQVNPVEYYFPGTLLHYAIDLSTLEDIDYVDEFNFDF